VQLSAFGRVGSTSSCPAIRAGIVSAAGIENVSAVKSAPHDHFTAGPHRRVTESGSGGVSGAGGCPTICAWIISSAGVKSVWKPLLAAPDDHLSASPHCLVTGSGIGRVDCAGRCPGIIYAATRGTSYDGKRVVHACLVGSDRGAR
jgi:hypothetical protein